ncbi:hypothetical protein GP486_001119 [Trichoglossum hirsutum]|uniref:VHS domain-containing protein n=1 Tax=Trichoglossum hirsutum TaxID=265104 RepID=A0A9P8LHS0_9PEZI|nr:hypothetical protein GP486_001119 [Trichoglossum hirsutum]
MFGGQKKPYTAVTVQIERLTSEQYEENDIGGIVELIEVIRIQERGPTEAARAIRKKLKYGSVHRQLRALAILDGLIQNAGPHFQRNFADEPLLERLRVAATDPVSDPDVRAKCKVLFGQWSVAYKNTPGMGGVAALYKQLPQRKKQTQQQQSKVLKETAADTSESARLGHTVSVSSGDGPLRSLNTPASPTSSSSRSLSLSESPDLMGSSKLKSSKNKKEKYKVKPFNLEKEKPQLLQTLASASVASTNLLNALKLINRESERVSENTEVMKRFETCKALRRQVLRYIQNVESEQWLGGLIHANEELVNALMAFEVLDKSVEDDSDSEDGDADVSATKHRRTASVPTRGFAGLVLEDKPAMPPRPGSNIPKPTAFTQSNGKGRQHSDDESESEEEEEEEEDENDPFADRNAVDTPFTELDKVRWYVSIF